MTQKQTTSSVQGALGEKRKKLAVITCYPDPDYIRGRVLQQALQEIANLQVVVAKNKQRNIFRYFEMVLVIIRIRLTQNPDAYLLTFRGYELILPLQLLAWPKAVILDEFINLYEWTVEEHHKVPRSSMAAKLLNTWWSFVLRHCKVILTDTQAHADHSAELSGVPIGHYAAIPVGADEKLFKPKAVASDNKSTFTVFYYGNMLPLHGLGYVIQAAELLKNEPGIAFQVVGGWQATTKAEIKRAQARGARIEYSDWIQFTELPEVIHNASLCLGGPFGDTIQSQLVVTGKTYQFLACGAPTVVGCSQASGVFVDKVNSLVVPQGDGKKIAETILWAYKHPKELSRIAENGRRLFGKCFSTEAVARSLEPVIRAALDR